MNTNKKITPFIEQFVKKLSPEAAITILPQSDSTIPIIVRAEDANMLIGQNGETLFEIQHLLKVILKKKLQEPVFVDLDINGYKKKKGEYLKELARLTADEVSLGRFKKFLAPMTAYERRIIHMELANRQDVITESVGEGQGRKIVIKPC